MHAAELEELSDVPDDPGADARFVRLLALRDEVYRELEVHRRDGEFGKGLEAALVLSGDRTLLDADLAATGARLEELCIISQVASGAAALASAAYPGLSLAVRRADGESCPRCWQVLPAAGHPAHPKLCRRCLDVVLRLEGAEEP